MPFPRPSIKDPILQLIRAKEHLDALEAELKMFHTTSPTEVHVHDNADGKRRAIQVIIPPPPERLGVIAEDYVFSLRATLDHLFRELCMVKSGGVDPGWADFPCAWSFNDSSGKNGTEARLRKRLESLPEAARSLVHELQPYHHGDDYKLDPLWRIDILCNLAKHKIIPLSGAFIDFNTNFDDKDIVSTYMPRLGEVIYVLTEDASTNVQIAPQGTAGVIFGSREDGIELGFKEMSNLYQYVRHTVMPKFLQFFLFERVNLP
jgi:hypothetical protein